MGEYHKNYYKLNKSVIKRRADKFNRKLARCPHCKLVMCQVSIYRHIKNYCPVLINNAKETNVVGSCCEQSSEGES